MPRQARKKSETGIYHVILRGINHRQIFYDSDDYTKFLQLLNDYKDECRYLLYAYCLMGNHVHLLLREGKEPLENIFRRLGSKYVYWYNSKYEREGALFQDRFKSEPVEDDAYLLTVLRYIHQNPIKAGLCKKPEEYLYSSYARYCETGSMIDRDFILELLPYPQFAEFHQEMVDQACLDVPERQPRRYTDEQAFVLICKIAKCSNPEELQQFNRMELERCLRKILKQDMPMRQLSRLTGLSVGFIRKI